MPITASDIDFRYSVKTGSAGDTTAGTAAGSLGKYISTTAITDNTLNNLFDDISGDENAASTVDYRCIFVINNHATLTLQNAVAWFSTEVSGGANAALAVDNIAISAKGASAAQAAEIANETTTPTGVGTFFSGAAIDTKAEGVTVGNLGPGQVKALWIRRTATNSAAQNNDGVTIRVEGDTAA